MKKIFTALSCGLLALLVFSACQSSQEPQQPPSSQEESQTPSSPAPQEEEAQEEEPQEETFQVGQTISFPDFCEITIHSITFTYDVLPDTQEYFYTHYEAQEGKIYLDIDLDVKNLQKQALPCDEIAEFTLDYNNGYTYSAFPVVEDSSTGFTYANISLVDPLETKAMRYLVDCPLEVYTEPTPLFLMMRVNGKDAKIILKDESGAATSSLTLNEASLSETQQAVIDEALAPLGIEIQWVENAPPFRPDIPEDAQSSSDDLNAIVSNFVQYFIHSTDGKLYLLTYDSKYNAVAYLFDVTDPNTNVEVLNNLDKIVDLYFASPTAASSPQPQQRQPVDMGQEDIVYYVDIASEE